MKILVCTFSFPCLGMGVADGRFVYSEVAGYADNGASVTVLTPHFPGAPLYEQPGERIVVRRFRYFLPRSKQVARRPGKPIYDLGSILAMLQIPLMLALFMLHIWRYARDADVIHAQWTVTALLALPARWLTGTPLVITARGSDIRLLPRWLNRFIFRKADASIDCFGPTQWNQQLKAEFPAHRIQLPLLVLDDYRGNCPAELLGKPFPILYVGRFHPIKLAENKLPLLKLLEAVAALKKQGRNLHLVYVGDGDPAIVAQIRQRIDQHGLQQQVTLAGMRTNVMDYMHHARLGIGGIAFNGVAQEYTICATPQILMKTPENEHAPWQHGRNCLLAEPENTNNLQALLAWAIDNERELAAIGSRARQDMSPFFIEARAGGGQYLKAFGQLLK